MTTLMDDGWRLIVVVFFGLLLVAAAGLCGYGFRWCCEPGLGEAMYDDGDVRCLNDELYIVLCIRDEWMDVCMHRRMGNLGSMETGRS